MGKIVRSKLSASVFKALGIFGSLEAMKMLCAVVRTKLVALWIGAAGVGIISLYNSTLEMIKSISLLNLRQSSVPSIAGAQDDERERICRYVELLGLIIGIATTILVLILSPLLSLMTFGSYNYSWGFALLAPTMLAASLTDARQAIMQGLRRLEVLAKATIWAVVASTVVTIPLFYFFRMAAIVPTMIIFPTFTVLFMFITPGTKVSRPPVDVALFRATVRSLVRLGSFLTIGISMGFVADYLLRIYISWQGGVDSVGMFQAGYIIVKNYVGLFFTAITMEFFPRLSSTIENRRYTSLVVAHEISIALWVLLPIVVLFMSVDDLIVKLLYSSGFLDVVPYISIAIIGTLLRAVSWCFSYVIVAKGDGKIYLVTEGSSAISLLLFSYFGWKYGGYMGLGIAYVGQFAVFTTTTWAVCKFRYGLNFPRSIGRLTLFAIGISSVALALRLWIAWWAPLILLLPIVFYSLKRLR